MPRYAHSGATGSANGAGCTRSNCVVDRVDGCLPAVEEALGSARTWPPTPDERSGAGRSRGDVRTSSARGAPYPTATQHELAETVPDTCAVDHRGRTGPTQRAARLSASAVSRAEVRRPARNSVTNQRASRRSAVTRSPARVGSSDGAITSNARSLHSSCQPMRPVNPDSSQAHPLVRIPEPGDSRRTGSSSALSRRPAAISSLAPTQPVEIVVSGHPLPGRTPLEGDQSTPVGSFRTWLDSHHGATPGDADGAGVILTDGSADPA